MTAIAESTLGPLFVSLLFDVVLLGMITAQAFVYFSRYQKDKVWLRSLVVFLVVANIVNSTFNTAFAYTALVAHYANPVSYTRVTWVFASGPAMTALIAFVVELFLIWRILALTQDLHDNLRWLAVIVAFGCSVGQLVGGMGTAIAMELNPVFDNFTRFSLMATIWLGCALVGNLLLVGLTVRHFHNNRGNFLHSGPVPDRIITALIQNGLSLAICTVVQFGLYFLHPYGHRMTHNLPLAKLYAATVLVSLNAREGWSWPQGYTVSFVGGQGTVVPSSNFSGVGFATNPAIATHVTGTRADTIVLHPIQYEAHEMNSVSAGGIKLERVRDMEWDSPISDNNDGPMYKF